MNRRTFNRSALGVLAALIVPPTRAGMPEYIDGVVGEAPSVSLLAVDKDGVLQLQVSVNNPTQSPLQVDVGSLSATADLLDAEGNKHTLNVKRERDPTTRSGGSVPAWMPVAAGETVLVSTRPVTWERSEAIVGKLEVSVSVQASGQELRASQSVAVGEQKSGS